MIIGIGTDIINFNRLEEIIHRQGQKFLDKIFTAQEQAFCESRNLNRIYAYGKTFAAKEATLKAISNTKSIKWHDIEITRLENGEPYISLFGNALKNISNKVSNNKGLQYNISLSDEPPYAIAFVIISAL